MQWFRKSLAFFFLAIIASMVVHAAVPHLENHCASLQERVFFESSHFHLRIASHDHQGDTSSEDFDLIDFLLNLHTHSDYSHTEYSFLSGKSVQPLDYQDQDFAVLFPCSIKFLVPNKSVVSEVWETAGSCLGPHLCSFGLRAPPRGFLFV
jgi:hypothetical protein